MKLDTAAFFFPTGIAFGCEIAGHVISFFCVCGCFFYAFGFQQSFEKQANLRSSLLFNFSFKIFRASCLGCGSL